MHKLQLAAELSPLMFIKLWYEKCTYRYIKCTFL